MPEKELYIFKLVSGVRPERVGDMSDFANGLPALLEARKYTQLPSLFPSIEVFSSDEAGCRFLVKVTHGSRTYVMMAEDQHQYSLVMTYLVTNYAILPELLFPEQPAGFSNLQTYHIPHTLGRRMIF